MANRRLTKLDKYIETRLWNAKLKNPNKTVPTRIIIQELIRYYGLEDRAKSDSHLRKMVKLARRRVYRKRTWLRHISESMANEHGIPTYLIQKWVILGYIKRENIKMITQIIEDLKKVFNHSRQKTTQ